MRVEDIGLHIPCFTPGGRSLVPMGMPGVTNTSQFSGMSRRVAVSVLSLFLLLVISLFPSWPNWRKEVRCWRLLLVLNSVGSGFIILKGVKWLVVLLFSASYVCFSRSVFNAPPQAMTWSNIAWTDFSCWKVGLTTLK